MGKKQLLVDLERSKGLCDSEVRLEVEKLLASYRSAEMRGSKAAWEEVCDSVVRVFSKMVKYAQMKRNFTPQEREDYQQLHANVANVLDIASKEIS